MTIRPAPRPYAARHMAPRRSPLRRFAVRWSPLRRRGDEGFVLLETLVAISLISVVMAAFTTFFVNAVASTSTQRATQAATQIADSTVDTLRGLPVSDLLTGRDASSVSTQFSSASTRVAPYLTSMVKGVDTSAVTGSGLTATIPTTALTQTVNNIAYSVNEYLGTCVIPTGTVSSASCGTAAASTGIQYVRAVVAVTWTGAHCQPPSCQYVTTTLLSAQTDPVFDPPTAPSVTAPANQSTVVGDVVNLRIPFTAMATYSWALTSGTLPTGLYLNATNGQIVGVPTTVAAATPLTFTVTDGLGRVATVSFTWAVVQGLVVTQPSPQANVTGTAITALNVSATGLTTPYVWSDPTSSLPPGLSLATVNNQAQVTGTPTTVGTYTVKLTVTDSATSHTGTTTFTWTISYPPFAATNPGSQTSTVGTAITNLSLATTGGSGSFTWSGGASLPAGLSLSTGGVISGTPTAAGTTSVTLTATDTKTTTARTVTFSWTVYARPTVTAPGTSLTVDVGQQVSFPLTTSCPNTPCTYKLNNGPGGLTISASGVVSGTIAGPAQTYSGATVTLTDNSGATATTSSISVIVNAAPAISTPANQQTTISTAATLNMAALVTGGTSPYTYAASNLPSWLTLNVSTGAITGTAPSTAATYTGISVTVTDANQISANTSSFSWVVGTVPGAPTGLTASASGTTAVLSWTAPTNTGGSAITGYTATASPGGATCTTTGALTCTITGLTSGTAYTVTVVARNAFGTGPASSSASTITCTSTAIAAGAYLAYPFNESSGTTAADVSGNNRPGTYTSAGVTYGASGPCSRDGGKAVTLNGSTGYITGATSTSNPQVFSIGIWFKTSVAGGKLIGLGNQATGNSGQYDRHIYVNSSGGLTFGVYVGGTKTISTSSTYTDNAWHYAMGTLAPSSDANPGLRLYVDGSLIVSDTSTTSAESVGSTSYWRIGEDNLGGWPNNGSNYFTGSLAFASVYSTALTPAQVLALYRAGT